MSPMLFWALEEGPDFLYHTHRTPIIVWRMMPMLETFTIATFSGRLGETFCINLASGTTLEAELIEVTQLSAQSAQGTEAPRPRAPFSLVFRSPAHTRLVQGIYNMAHPGIGAFELFLVPIGLDAQGLRCEAIFT